MHTTVLLFATSLIALTACADRAADAPPADRTAASAGDGSAARCGDPVRVADLDDPLVEASGLAASRHRPGVLWLHNDSDTPPRLFVHSADGSRVGVVNVPGLRSQRQWEDIASGPCPAGDCLYIGDIGDNLARRPNPGILRLPEPAPDARESAVPERFRFSYPDGPEDAEAMFVLSDTTVYIITKGRQGPITLYRIPRLESPGTVVLERIQELSDGLVQLPRMVTGAAASPDGRLIAVRTYSFLQLYRMSGGRLEPLLAGDGYDLGPLAEPQGEAVAVLDDGTVFLATEEGPFNRQPFLSRIQCRVPDPETRQ
jgi:hypothetical protein